MSRPKRAPTSLDAAQASFQEGHYQEALDRASSIVRRAGPDWREAAVLAARVHLRTATPAAAVALLERAHQRAPEDSTVATLLGVAHVRLGDKAIGLALIEDAHRRARDDEERAEASYYRAWAAYIERDLDAADRWIATSLDEASGVVYARGLALSGWISEARGDYSGAIRAHRLALGALRNGEERDDELAARIVHGLALFAAETPDVALAEFVRVQAEIIAWPASGSAQRFQTALHLAIARVNEGVSRLRSTSSNRTKRITRFHSRSRRSRRRLGLNRPTCTGCSANPSRLAVRCAGPRGRCDASIGWRRTSTIPWRCSSARALPRGSIRRRRPSGSPGMRRRPRTTPAGRHSRTIRACRHWSCMLGDSSTLRSRTGSSG